jgi:hypothetical protein
MFTAILLVTVFVVDAETAVEDKMLPDTAGSVRVVVPATACVWIVAAPEVSPVISIELIVNYLNLK